MITEEGCLIKGFLLVAEAYIRAQSAAFIGHNCQKEALAAANAADMIRDLRNKEDLPKSF